MKKRDEKFRKIKPHIPNPLRFGAFLFGILFSTFAFAQTAARWQQVYGGPGHEYGYRVRSCMDQGYIVAGSTASAGVSDGYVVRTDSLGLIMWSKYYAGNNVDVLRSICQLPDSGYIMAGYSNSGGNGGYDGWVLRTDKNGDTTWTRYFGTSDWDFFYDVAPTWDGGFVLAGGTYGLGSGDEDMYFVKIDSLGDTLWTKTYGGAEADEARAVIETGDSMLVACGFSYSLGDTAGDSWILRMNNLTGDTVWTRTAGQPAVADKAWGLTDYLYGRFLIAGESEIGGDLDGYVISMDTAGTPVFYIPLNPSVAGDEVMCGIVTKPNGDFVAVGTTENGGGGDGDMYFFGSVGFSGTTFGTVEEDAGFSVDVAKDGGYIACGYTVGYNSTLPNVYLVKIDSAYASTLVLNIREPLSVEQRNRSFAFPNPADAVLSVTIDADRPFSGNLALEIFDLAGKKIGLAPAEWQSNTSRSATCRLETATLPAGVYLYTITDDGVPVSCGKFVVGH